MWQGIQTAKRHNLQLLIVEGDSQILINMATRIQNGSHARKIANSWRLEARLSCMAEEICKYNAISFHHTKREGNKIADLLANIGVDSDQPFLEGHLDIIPSNLRKQECESLIHRDNEAPDAGVGLIRTGEPHAQHGLPRVNSTAPRRKPS